MERCPSADNADHHFLAIMVRALARGSSGGEFKTGSLFTERTARWTRSGRCFRLLGEHPGRRCSGAGEFATSVRTLMDSGPLIPFIDAITLVSGPVPGCPAPQEQTSALCHLHPELIHPGKGVGVVLLKGVPRRKVGHGWVARES